jgi:hypothetical protein
MVAEKLEQSLRSHLANQRVNVFPDKAGVIGYQRPGTDEQRPIHPHKHRLTHTHTHTYTGTLACLVYCVRSLTPCLPLCVATSAYSAGPDG